MFHSSCPCRASEFLRYNIDWTEANLASARQKLDKNKAGLAGVPNAAAILRNANEALAKEQAVLDEARKLSPA